MTCTGSHWFAYYGLVGTSSPTCVRAGCDAPNPHYDRSRDPLVSKPKPNRWNGPAKCYREQMVEKAAQVLWEAAWPDCPWEEASPEDKEAHLDDAELVVDAIIPQIFTANELERLPTGALLLTDDGIAHRWVPTETGFWKYYREVLINRLPLFLIYLP
jgi:hypothetical protein